VFFTSSSSSSSSSSFSFYLTMKTVLHLAHKCRALAADSAFLRMTEDSRLSFPWPPLTSFKDTLRTVQAVLLFVLWPKIWLCCFFLHWRM
jgi:hypothetical protein